MRTLLALLGALSRTPDPDCDVAWALSALRERDRTALYQSCRDGASWVGDASVVHAVVASRSWQTAGLLTLLDKSRVSGEAFEIGREVFESAERHRARYAEIEQVQQFLDAVLARLAAPASSARPCPPLFEVRRRYRDALRQCRLGACISPPFLLFESDLSLASQTCPDLPPPPRSLADFRFLTIHTEAIEEVTIISATATKFVVHRPNLANARRVEDVPVVIVPVFVNAPYSARLRLVNGDLPVLHHDVAAMDPPAIGRARNASCVQIDAFAPGNAGNTSLWLDGTRFELGEESRYSLTVGHHDHRLTAITCRGGRCFVRFTETISADRLTHSPHLCTSIEVVIPEKDTIGLLATRVEEQCAGVAGASRTEVTKAVVNYVAASPGKFPSTTVEDLDENIRLSEELTRIQEQQGAPIAGKQGRISEPWSFDAATTSLREVWRRGISDLLVLTVNCPQRPGSRRRGVVVDATRIAVRQYYAPRDSERRRGNIGPLHRFTTEQGPGESLESQVHSALDGVFDHETSRFREATAIVRSHIDPEVITLDVRGERPLRVRAQWLGTVVDPGLCEREELRRRSALRAAKTPEKFVFDHPVGGVKVEINDEVKHPGNYRLEVARETESGELQPEDAICVDYRQRRWAVWPSIEMTKATGRGAWTEFFGVKVGLGFTFVPRSAPLLGFGLEVDYAHAKMDHNIYAPWLPTESAWNSWEDPGVDFHELNWGAHLQVRPRVHQDILIPIQLTFNTPIRAYNAAQIPLGESLLRDKRTGSVLWDFDLAIDVRVGIRLALTDAAAMTMFPIFPTRIIDVGGDAAFSLFDNDGWRLSFLSFRIEGNLR